MSDKNKDAGKVKDVPKKKIVYKPKGVPIKRSDGPSKVKINES